MIDIESNIASLKLTFFHRIVLKKIIKLYRTQLVFEKKTYGIIQ